MTGGFGEVEEKYYRRWIKVVIDGGRERENFGS